MNSSTFPVLSQASVGFTCSATISSGDLQSCGSENNFTGPLYNGKCLTEQEVDAITRAHVCQRVDDKPFRYFLDLEVTGSDLRYARPSL